MSLTHRFSKWLAREIFNLHHNPGDPPRRFTVHLFSKVNPDPNLSFPGYGSTIAEAAKDARKRRDAAK